YFDRHGIPEHRADLSRHACLFHRFPSSGKFVLWPLRREAGADDLDLHQVMVSNKNQKNVHVAHSG
ncbi:LysR family transcriptional regulator, partial [Pseudomonas syringae pv. tagetis]